MPVPLHPAQFSVSGTDTEHGVLAKRGGDVVGHLLWDKQSGRVSDVHVEEAHRLQGIGKGMWNYAQDFSVPPRHSEDRSDDGDGFAKRVGGPLPPRTANTWAARGA